MKGEGPLESSALISERPPKLLPVSSESALPIQLIRRLKRSVLVNFGGGGGGDEPDYWNSAGLEEAIRSVLTGDSLDPS